MPEDSMTMPEEGFRAYRSSPLPSGSQPLVILSWRNYQFQGDALFDILCFVLTQDALLQAKGTNVQSRQFRNRHGQELTLSDCLEFVVDGALEFLEGKAQAEYTAAEAAKSVFQTITLAKITTNRFQRIALRQSWRTRWNEVRDLAPYTPLKHFLDDLVLSPLLRLGMTDLLATKA